MFAIWALQWVSLKVERSDYIWPLPYPMALKFTAVGVPLSDGNRS